MSLLAYVILGARALVFAGFAFSAVVALTHWAVKHGHLSHFTALARGVRRIGAPVVLPMERALLRRGANPASAPYAVFWVALLGGLALLGILEWLIGTVLSLFLSASAGPRGLLLFGVNAVFSLLMFAIFIRVIASWFAVSPYSRFMRPVYALTDWLIEPLRRVVPTLGMIDITPLIAYFMLYLARGFVLGLL